MKKIITLLLLHGTENYDISHDIPIEYIFDEEINDCLLYMYLFLLTDEDDTKHEEYYKKFSDSYEKLSMDKQMIIEENFNNIKNSKEKVKKKGNDKYE